MKVLASFIAGLLASWVPEAGAVAPQDVSRIVAQVANHVELGRQGYATFTYDSEVYAVYVNAAAAKREERWLTVSVRPAGEGNAVCHSFEDRGLDGTVDVVAFGYVPPAHCIQKRLAPEESLPEVRYASPQNTRLKSRYMDGKEYWQRRYDTAVRAVARHYAKR